MMHQLDIHTNRETDIIEGSSHRTWSSGPFKLICESESRGPQHSNSRPYLCLYLLLLYQVPHILVVVDPAIHRVLQIQWGLYCLGMIWSLLIDWMSLFSFPFLVVHYFGLRLPNTQHDPLYSSVREAIIS